VSIVRRHRLRQFVVGIVQMLHQEVNVLGYVWHPSQTDEGRLSEFFIPARGELGLVHDEG